MSEQTQTPQQPQEPEKSKGTSDDKCIGSRRVRTVILGCILLAFSIFAAGYIGLLIDDAKNTTDFPTGCQKCKDAADEKVHGANMIMAGLVFIMLFCIITMLVAVIPACNPNKTKAGRIPAGIGLLFGATFYILGWIWYIGSDKEIKYDFLSSDEQEDQDAVYLSWFGECLLYGATVVLVGVDLLIPHRFLLEDEYKRLFLNLGVLCVVSILVMPAYFLLTDEDGAAVIGTGYIIIFVSTLIYIILFILTCCTNDCKDKCAVRVTLAIAIFLGGFITSIGYYIFAGGHSNLGRRGDEAKEVAYYIGYTILVGGLSAVWALDIAFDDIKANNQK